MDDTQRDNLYRFFDALFEQDDRVEVRFLPPMKTKSNQWFLDSPDIIVAEWEDIDDRNKRQDVYFGVNPRAERAGTAEAIRVCRCVFADFDHVTAEEATRRIDAATLPEPTVMVSSGHGIHTYWRLEEPIDPTQWRAVQRGIIAALDCDAKVKDPPRIMRLPYTKHVAKHKGGDPTWCRILYNRETRHDIEDIVMRLPITDAEPERGEGQLPDGERAPLPAWANAFLVGGSDSGSRNQTAFDVSCCMAGAGWPREDAERMIVAAAERCTPPLPEDEALASVASAYSKERSPATPDPATLPLGSSWQIAAGMADRPPSRMTVKVETPATAGPAMVAVEGDALHFGEPIHRQPVGRFGFLSNVIESVDKEGNITTHPRPVAQVVAALQQVTGGWPRRAGGRLFVPGDQPEPGELPRPTAIRSMDRVDAGFAWMHAHTDLYWADGKRCSDQMDGSSRTSIKRGEFYEHLKDTAQPHYDATEVLPHCPPADRTWYAPCILPASDRGILDDLVDRLNYETAIDRGLMLAAVLTLFWGGPCGQRPAFLFSSQYGAGSGKTASAEMIARVAGGTILLGKDETPDQLTKRLLSDSALAKRVVLADNIKGKMDVAGIEAMVTAGEISGHRMYHGHATRPNRLTWIITANVPNMSHDLAERSVNIRIGTQRADSAWRTEIEDWIDANRAALVSAALGVLAGPDAETIEQHNLDRWARWQASVLAKVEGANEIAVAVLDRRQDLDADRDEAEDIALIVKALIRLKGHSPDEIKAFVERKALADAYQACQDDNDKWGRRKTVSYINNRVGSGALRQIRVTKWGGRRGWQWVGEACLDPDHYGCVVNEMPPDFGADDVHKERGYEDENE